VHAQTAVVEAIEFKGLERTKEKFLRRIIKTKPNAPIDSAKVALDIERLNRLPGIAKATFVRDTVTNGNQRLTYIIDENFTIIPGLRISTAANGDFAFRVSLFEFNALGANHLIGGYYQNEVFSSYGAFVESRYLFSNRLGLGINFQNNNTFEPIFFDNETIINYRYLNTVFETYLMYEFDFRNRGEIGFSLENDQYTFEDGAINVALPNQLSTDRLNLRAQYEYINIDIDYQYVTGWRDQIDVQVLTRGDGLLTNNLIINNDLEYLTRIGKRGNWASRLRLGFATNNTSPFAPFVVDNQINIRGGGNVVARGTASATINTEYRHTLLEKGWFVLQSNTFLDVNTQRQVGQGFSSAFDTENVRIAPGVGVRFIHKRIFIAVFRLDYGIGIGADATSGLVFGIGQYF
jgi:outer membrane protein assembly factor BamA